MITPLGMVMAPFSFATQDGLTLMLRLSLGYLCAAQADLEDTQAFIAPIMGCKYVLHTASPVVMAPPKGKVRPSSCLVPA